MVKHLAKCTEGREIWIFKLVELDGGGFRAVKERFKNGERWDAWILGNPRFKRKSSAIKRIKREILEGYNLTEVEWMGVVE